MLTSYYHLLYKLERLDDQAFIWSLTRYREDINISSEIGCPVLTSKVAANRDASADIVLKTDVELTNWDT